jgi:Tfp pilus assembly protein PilF
LYQQALAIREKLAPNSLDVAGTLDNLGNVAYSRGDLARAEQLYQRALAIREKLAPNSLQVATDAQQSGECGLFSW